MKNPLTMKKTLTEYGCTYGVYIENCHTVKTCDPVECYKRCRQTADEA